MNEAQDTRSTLDYVLLDRELSAAQLLNSVRKLWTQFRSVPWDLYEVCPSELRMTADLGADGVLDVRAIAASPEGCPAWAGEYTGLVEIRRGNDSLPSVCTCLELAAAAWMEHRFDVWVNDLPQASEPQCLPQFSPPISPRKDYQSKTGYLLTPAEFAGMIP